VKNFRASTTCSKILNGKKSIQLIQDTLFFRARTSCSKILNVKVYSIGPTVKIFRANSVFQDKRKLLKILNSKKYIQCSGKFHDKLCFSG